MKLSAKILGVIVLFLSPALAMAGTETLNFDDINGEDFALVPDGYGSLTWSNFQVMSHSFEQGIYAGSHADNADVSAPNFIYDGGGADASISSDTPFTLQSLDLGSFFADSNEVTITGYNDVTPVGSVSFTVTGDSTLEQVDLADVTSVVFSSTEGNQFSIDNMTLSGDAIPEPSTYLLVLLSAVVTATFAGRRRLMHD